MRISTDRLSPYYVPPWEARRWIVYLDRAVVPRWVEVDDQLGEVRVPVAGRPDAAGRPQVEVRVGTVRLEYHP
jgi:hypothetical protein